MSAAARGVRAAVLAATLTLAASFAVLYCNRSELLGRPELPGLLVNSDTLLPAAWVADLIAHPASIATFQLPRVPSLLPDIAVVTALQLALGGWRAATLGYAACSFMALVAVGGAVAAQLAGRRFAAGAAMVLPLAVAVLLLTPYRLDVAAGYLSMFVPVTHSGSFLLVLATLLLARTMLARPTTGRLVSLAALAAAGALSDKLFIGAFLPPLFAALAALVWRGDLPRGAALRVGGAALCGIVASLPLDRAIFPHLLLRQPDMDMSLAAGPAHLRLMLRHPLVPYLLVAALLAVAAPLRWRPVRAAQAFWWAAIAAMLPAFLLLGALLYVNDGSMRYLQPVMWLPLFVLAAVLLSLRVAVRHRAAAVGLPLAAVLGWLLLQPWPRPALFGWHLPLAACLQQARMEGRLHAGLATYWLARPIEASSDWSQQVGQITGNGGAYLWGNNRYWYGHSRADIDRPPATDFIVADQLDPAAITRRYGQSTGALACPLSTVWLYPPGQLDQVLASVAAPPPGPAAVGGPICLRPGAFLTDHGPVAGPVVMPDTARPDTIAIFGPYLDLQPGRWRFSLRYRLTSPTGGGRWEVTSNTGKRQLAAAPLPVTGDGVVTAHLEVARQVPNVELRSRLGPGDRFELLGTEVAPEDSDAHPCRWN